MDLRFPPPKIKNPPESNPLKSKFLVGGLGVAACIENSRPEELRIRLSRTLWSPMIASTIIMIILLLWLVIYYHDY